tara:strand:+ start:15 stop:257 length:243 start_codon:yes stop_codon:yes gene_type:complete
MRDIAEVIMHFRNMERHASSMLREVKWQFRDMANGGDGGILGFRPDGWTKNREPTCRDYNYPDHPDEFFAEVCDLMSWER